MNSSDNLLKNLKWHDFVKSVSTNFNVLCEMISSAIGVGESDIKKNIVLDSSNIEKPYDLITKIESDYIIIKTSKFNKFIKNIPEYGRFYFKKFIDDEQSYIIYINLESIHNSFYDGMLEQEFKKISDIMNIDINDKENLKDYSILVSCLRLLPKENLDEIRNKDLTNVMISINYDQKCIDSKNVSSFFKNQTLFCLIFCINLLIDFFYFIVIMGI